MDEVVHPEQVRKTHSFTKKGLAAWVATTLISGGFAGVGIQKSITPESKETAELKMGFINEKFAIQKQDTSELRRDFKDQSAALRQDFIKGNEDLLTVFRRHIENEKAALLQEHNDNLRLHDRQDHVEDQLRADITTLFKSKRSLTN